MQCVTAYLIENLLNLLLPWPVRLIIEDMSPQNETKCMDIHYLHMSVFKSSFCFPKWKFHTLVLISPHEYWIISTKKIFNRETKSYSSVHELYFCCIFLLSISKSINRLDLLVEKYSWSYIYICWDNLKFFYRTHTEW